MNGYLLLRSPPWRRWALQQQPGSRPVRVPAQIPREVLARVQPARPGPPGPPARQELREQLG